MNWQPESELTQATIDNARYLLVIADDVLWLFDGEACLNGLWTLSNDDGQWSVVDIIDSDGYVVTHFVVIDALPEA